MTETLLIVEPDFPSSCAMVESLTPGRYRTLTAPEFGIAMQLLYSERPQLLITVVRLGQFIGAMEDAPFVDRVIDEVAP